MTEQQQYEDALKFTAVWLGFSNPREFNWGAEAIDYAGIEDFKLKEENLYFERWKLKVEFYFNKKLLLFNPRLDYRDLHLLEDNFHRALTRIEYFIYELQHPQKTKPTFS